MTAQKTDSSKVLLRLSVPRNCERGPVAFEQVLASLHGLLMKSQSKMGDEAVSFEIIRHHGKVHFCVVTPKHLKNLISSQIYAQYPEVEIQEDVPFLTEDLLKEKNVLLATLRPAEPEVFPFKRHPQFVDGAKHMFEDPLGSISAALSHLPKKDDFAMVQIVVSPISPVWNAVAQKVLRRFWKGGPWQWDWFRHMYTRARLAHTRKDRVKNFWKWGFINLFFGWGAGPALKEAGAGFVDDEDDAQLDRESQTSGRHDRETSFSASYDKLTRLNFSTNVRAVYVHSDSDALRAEAKMREITGTFQQFSLPRTNHFTISTFTDKPSSDQFQRIVDREAHKPFALSQEELATIFHLPTETVSSPGIDWVDSPKFEPPADLPTDSEKDVTLLGETNFRNIRHKYGLRPDDRRRHVYIIGKTGMGKSTLLENMIFSDIEAGKGVCVVDPHGDLAEAVLRFVPKSRTNDVIYFDPADREYPVAFNMLEGKNPEQRTLVASALLGVIKKMYIDSWGPRLEHFLRNTILALVEAPDTTMLGISRMLVDKKYRQKILKFVTDPMVKSFWETEFSALAPQKLAEAVGPIQNKVGQFLSSPMIRNILGQPKSTIDFRFEMDKGKIVIVNLSKGKLGEDNSSLLGSMLITKFQIDAMSRADIPEKDRRDFYLYVDEFQNFATDSFSTILSEARKYRLNLTMANQYVAQMSEEVAAAVFGNVGTLISFQVGIDDAKVFAEQFDEEKVEPINLASIPKYAVYNRIMVDGLTTPIFSGKTLPPPELITDEDTEERVAKILKFSRQRYAKPRDVVEDKIMRWTRAEEEKSNKSKSEKSDKPEKKPDKKKS